MPEHLLHRLDVGAGADTARLAAVCLSSCGVVRGTPDASTALLNHPYWPPLRFMIAAVSAGEQQRIAIAALTLARQVGQ